mgnify:CR=1 FL=1
MVEENTFEMLIIGGGPAALSAALYSKRKQLSTAVVAKEIGGQLLWTNEIQNYPGYSSISGYGLLKKFQEHLEEYEPNIIEGETVQQLQLGEDKLFNITTDSGKNFSGKSVIIASGKRPRRLQVPGEKKLTGKGVSYCTTCDAPLFADRDVAVIGGGNAAFEGLLDLIPIAGKVYNINRSAPRAEPLLQKRVDLNQVNTLHKHEVVEIIGEDAVEGILIRDKETGQERKIDLEGVFVEIGLIPNVEFIPEELQTNDAGEIMVDCGSRTNIEGLLAAGDVTNVPEKQVVISAGEGAKAALGGYRYLIRNGGSP